MELILGDIHGHSSYVDGTSSVGDIVDHGIKKGLRVIGVTDHQSCRSAREVLELSDGDGFIPCVGAELESQWSVESRPFHTIIAQFGEKTTPAFLNDLERCTQTIPLLGEALRMVKNHDALLLFPHPGVYPIKGIPFSVLDRFCRGLDPEPKLNIGIETKNWMVKMFVGTEPIYAYFAELMAAKHCLARFGSSDYHFGEHIGKQSTVFPIDCFSGEAVMETIKRKRIYPHDGSSMSVLTLLKLGLFVAKRNI